MLFRRACLPFRSPEQQRAAVLREWGADTPAGTGTEHHPKDIGSPNAAVNPHRVEGAHARTAPTEPSSAFRGLIRLRRTQASLQPLPSEITPPERYFNRRDVITALAAAGAVGAGLPGRLQGPAEVHAKSSIQPERGPQFLRRYNDLQQLLRIWHR
ncbi:MAG: twin-arginine translocation signal domain-containing protein [Proteobacteria bacterium]|nr:twin-arginine translocation signal domain-containing protein [Pseudomonadota bacterium]